MSHPVSRVHVRCQGADGVTSEVLLVPLPADDSMSRVRDLLHTVRQRVRVVPPGDLQQLSLLVATDRSVLQEESTLYDDDVVSHVLQSGDRLIAKPWRVATSASAAALTLALTAETGSAVCSPRLDNRAVHDDDPGTGFPVPPPWRISSEASSYSRRKRSRSRGVSSANWPHSRTSWDQHKHFAASEHRASRLSALCRDGGLNASLRETSASGVDANPRPMTCRVECSSVPTWTIEHEDVPTWATEQEEDATAVCAEMEEQEDVLSSESVERWRQEGITMNTGPQSVPDDATCSLGWWWCRPCCCPLASWRIADTHIKGKRHRRSSASDSQKPSPYVETREREDGHGKTDSGFSAQDENTDVDGSDLLGSKEVMVLAKHEEHDEEEEEQIGAYAARPVEICRWRGACSAWKGPGPIRHRCLQLAPDSACGVQGAGAAREPGAKGRGPRATSRAR